MNKIQIRNTLLLVLTAFIWGCSNVSEYVGAGHVGPFTFIASRNWLGGTILLPLIWFLDRTKKQDHGVKAIRSSGNRKELFIGGLLCGVFLFFACAVQQAGIAYTTPAKTGFITSLYTIIVPIITIFLGKKVGRKIWFCVVVGFIGLYLLCMVDSTFTLNKGDSLILLCSILFSVHILVVDHFAPKMNGVKLSCIQFFVSAVLSTVLMLIFEKPTWDSVSNAAIPILYSGIISSGMGYTLQIIGQKDLNPTIASLSMSLESVFTVLAGFVILRQGLTIRELVGGTLMFSAVIIAQLPDKKMLEKISTASF